MIAVQQPIARVPWLKPSRSASQFDKVWIRTLYEDKAKGESTVLIKLEPGAHLPFHKHPELEQAYVLEGSMTTIDPTRVRRFSPSTASRTSS